MDPSNILQTDRNMPQADTPRTKKLPQAIDLEESVLGALLIEKNTLIDVITILKPSTFSREANALIYQAIISLFNNSLAIDPRTVVNELRKQGTLEKVGGSAYISSLIDSVASAEHIEDHARILVQYQIRRELIRTANTIRYNAYDDTQDTFQVLDKASQAIFDISDTNTRNEYRSVEPLIHNALQELAAKKDNPANITGITTGFIELDRFILGWQASDMVIIAARPGMGKTTFMQSSLCNTAIHGQIPVAFFSLEMAAHQLVSRMIAAEAEIDGEKLKRAQLAQYEWEQVNHTSKRLADAPIYIDDTPALSIFELRSKCRRLKLQHQVQVVYIDYLQLMVDDTTRNSNNREQQIACISRSIKAIAKELNIAVVVASQLSRSVETRGGDKRPQLSDLRESGAIEQDADLVIFPYRPAYYGITQEEEVNTENLAEVIIAKHRNGPTGKVNLQFLPEFTKFTSATPQPNIRESKLNNWE